jgi:2',5'-phosphodiesterase
LFQRAEDQQLDRWDSLSDIDSLLENNPELSCVIREKVGQVMQVAELHLRSPKVGEQSDRIVVGNTHLFYHPLADHIRAMQAYMVCRQMYIVRKHDNSPCLLFLCGDFNSGPSSGAVHLLLERKVGPDHRGTWKHLHEYAWDMGDEKFLLEHEYIGNDKDSSGDPLYIDEAFEDAVQCLDAINDVEVSTLTHPSQIRLPAMFPLLRSGYAKIPAFTNYAVDFSDTLDYILASESSNEELYGLAPKCSALMPTTEMMTSYGAMPNEFMPSDHVSLVCDLAWEHSSIN